MIYDERRKVLLGEDLKETVVSMVDDVVKQIVAYYAGEETYSDEWDLPGLVKQMEQTVIPGLTITAGSLKDKQKEEVIQLFTEEAHQLYEAREAELTPEIMRQIERSLLLVTIDRKWMDHIDAMDQLRDGIGLRAYGQKDPVNEYKLESLDMFEEMVHLIQEDTLRRLCMSRIEKAPERRAAARATGDNSGEMNAAPARAPRPMPVSPAGAPRPQGTAAPASAPAKPIPYKAGQKIGRNSPCPCGSGKKYKNCHGKDAEA